MLYWALGLHFDGTTFPGYMQFIDSELLQTRMVESLWYYHANPPMLNLLVGVAHKIFGEHAIASLNVFFHALGLVTAFAVYFVSRELSSSRIAAVTATGLLVFSPAFVLYENWLMYSFPTVALLTTSVFWLHRFVSTRNSRYCAGFFVTLALLLLTRSLFHLAWLLVIVALLLVVSPGVRRQVLVAAIGPVLIVGFWYAKNWYYFGSFGSSTWLGLGLSNISTLIPTKQELQPLVDEGRLSRFALLSRYRDIDTLFSVEEAPTGIPVLDQVRKSTGEYNFNNARIVSVNRYYTSDGVTVIRTFPYYYTIGLLISNKLFFSPPNMNLYFTAQNRAAVRPMERIFNPLLYGVSAESGLVRQPHFGFSDRSLLEVNTSIPLILVWWLLLGYGYTQMRRAVLSSYERERPRAVAIGFIVVTALYLYAVGTAFELAENYRYRYNVEPLMFALGAAAVTDLIRKARAILRSRQRH
jgi:hypothetical protein